MHRMGAQRGGKVTGVCPSAALDSLPPSEPRAPFPATAVGATSVAVAFPRFYCPRRRLTERADPLVATAVVSDAFGRHPSVCGRLRFGIQPCPRGEHTSSYAMGAAVVSIQAAAKRGDCGFQCRGLL